MKPVVVNPAISFEQLFDELSQVAEEDYRSVIRDQILVKLRQRLQRLADSARQSYEAHSGETPEETLLRFRTSPLMELAGWVRERPSIGQILDWNSEGGSGGLLPISRHLDRVIAVTRGYGTGQKPDDFLDGFTAYIRDNVNEVVALTVVLQLGAS